MSVSAHGGLSPRSPGSRFSSAASRRSARLAAEPVAAIQVQRRRVRRGHARHEPGEPAVDGQPLDPVEQLVGHAARLEPGVDADAADRQRVALGLDGHEPGRLAARTRATKTSARSSSSTTSAGVVALRVAGALGERMQGLFGEQQQHPAVVAARLADLTLDALHAHLRKTRPADGSPCSRARRRSSSG